MPLKSLGFRAFFCVCLQNLSACFADKSAQPAVFLPSTPHLSAKFVCMGAVIQHNTVQRHEKSRSPSLRKSDRFSENKINQRFLKEKVDNENEYHYNIY